MNSAVSSPQKLLTLESARGLAALTIVLYHLEIIGITRQIPFLKNAYLFVDFFFVLSGFVIGLNYVNKIENGRQIANFMRKRFWRLYPLQLVMLIVATATVMSKWLVVKYIAGSAAVDSDFSKCNAYTFLNHLFLTQGLTEAEHFPFNGVSWSISTEFWTYLVFALTVFALGSIRRVYLLPIVSGFFSLTCIFMLMPIAREHGNMNLQTEGAILRCITGFFLGVIILYVYKLLLNRKVMWRGDTIGWLSLLGALTLMSFYNEIQIREYVLILFLFSSGIIGLCLATNDSVLYRILSNSWLVYFGTLSYSIYMVHVVVEFFAKNIFRFMFKIPLTTIADGTIRLDFTKKPFLEFSLIFIVYACVLSLSYLTYNYIEDRFRRGLKVPRAVSQPQIATAPVVVSPE